MNLKKTSSYYNFLLLSNGEAEVSYIENTIPVSISSGATVTNTIAEKIIDDYSLGSLPYASANDWAKVQKDLNFLNRKADSIRKTLTFWDIYNIRGTVTKDTIIGQLAQLPNNSSLIVRDKEFEWNGTTYYLGDMLIKDSNGSILHIPAQTAGYYYPSNYHLNNNTLSISYAYDTAAPLEGSATIGSASAPYNVMNASITLGSDSGVIYNKSGTLSAGASVSYAFQSVSSNRVEPIIYYYIGSDSGQDRIYFDNDYVESGSNFVLKNDSKSSVYYIIK